MRIPVLDGFVESMEPLIAGVLLMQLLSEGQGMH